MKLYLELREKEGEERVIRKTSKKAYEDLKQSGKALSQKEQIYKMVDLETNGTAGSVSRSHGITLKELSRKYDLEINVVSGRINDLKKLGMIKECYKRKCDITKRTVIPVTVGDCDVGGVAHANLEKEATDEQEGFGFDVETKKTPYEWPD